MHQILPAVITCIVAKNLSNDDEDHFTTRKFSAHILHSIINNFGTTYHGLQARVTKTLSRALLDESKPLSSLFGALYALKVMGPEVIGLFVIPHVKILQVRISSQMVGVDECKQLLLEICANHFNSLDRDEKSLNLYGDLKNAVKAFK